MSLPRVTELIEICKDNTTNSIKTIDYAHHEIHDGSAFTASYKADIANSANLDLLIVTPDSTKYAHFTYVIEVELETDGLLYEGVTATAGSAVAAYNRNRNSLTEPTVVITSTPTAITTGTTIIRSGHYGSGKTIGGNDRTVNELILKRNTKYLLRLTNVVTNASNYMSVRLNWYEHTNI